MEVNFQMWWISRFTSRALNQAEMYNSYITRIHFTKQFSNPKSSKLFVYKLCNHIVSRK